MIEKLNLPDMKITQSWVDVTDYTPNQVLLAFEEIYAMRSKNGKTEALVSYIIDKKTGETK